MNNNPITLDRNLAKKLDQGMRNSNTIELPFPVVYIWALNGQAAYKSQGGALYFGGWACKADNAQATAEQQGLPIPAGWSQTALDTKDGQSFAALVTRNVLVAPIGKRESWILDDGKRSPHYVEGGRRHIQVLCYLAETKGENGAKQIVPWGPVVLTAKGYQAKNLLGAFTAWNKLTANLRYKVAPGVPAWCFFLSLGTYGKERQAVNVGQPGAQSPITPISVYTPETMDEARMRSLFVGEEVAGLMADYQDRAAEWLAAWNGPVEEPVYPPDDEFATGGPELMDPDAEIPF